MPPENVAHRSEGLSTFSQLLAEVFSRDVETTRGPAAAGDEGECREEQGFAEGDGPSEMLQTAIRRKKQPQGQAQLEVQVALAIKSTYGLERSFSFATFLNDVNFRTLMV